MLSYKFWKSNENLVVLLTVPMNHDYEINTRFVFLSFIFSIVVGRGKTAPSLDAKPFLTEKIIGQKRIEGEKTFIEG